MRVDAGSGPIVMLTRKDRVELALGPIVEGRWREATGAIDALGVGQRVQLTAGKGGYRNFHVWIVRAH